MFCACCPCRVVMQQPPYNGCAPTLSIVQCWTAPLPLHMHTSSLLLGVCPVGVRAPCALHARLCTQLVGLVCKGAVAVEGTERSWVGPVSPARWPCCDGRRTDHCPFVAPTATASSVMGPSLYGPTPHCPTLSVPAISVPAGGEGHVHADRQLRRHDD